MITSVPSKRTRFDAAVARGKAHAQSLSSYKAVQPWTAANYQRNPQVAFARDITVFVIAVLLWLVTARLYSRCYGLHFKCWLIGFFHGGILVYILVLCSKLLWFAVIMPLILLLLPKRLQVSWKGLLPKRAGDLADLEGKLKKEDLRDDEKEQKRQNAQPSAQYTLLLVITILFLAVPMATLALRYDVRENFCYQPPFVRNNIHYMVEMTIEILSRNGIPSWLDCGTLLGYWRNHDTIRWDPDAEIALPRMSKAQFMSIIPQFEEAGMIPFRLNSTHPKIKMSHYDPTRIEITFHDTREFERVCKNCPSYPDEDIWPLHICKMEAPRGQYDALCPFQIVNILKFWYGEGSDFETPQLVDRRHLFIKHWLPTIPASWLRMTCHWTGETVHEPDSTYAQHLPDPTIGHREKERIRARKKELLRAQLEEERALARERLRQKKLRLRGEAD